MSSFNLSTQPLQLSILLSTPVQLNTRQWPQQCGLWLHSRQALEEKQVKFGNSFSQTRSSSAPPTHANTCTYVLTVQDAAPKWHVQCWYYSRAFFTFLTNLIIEPSVAMYKLRSILGRSLGEGNWHGWLQNMTCWKLGVKINYISNKFKSKSNEMKTNRQLRLYRSRLLISATGPPPIATKLIYACGTLPLCPITSCHSK